MTEFTAAPWEDEDHEPEQYAAPDWEVSPAAQEAAESGGEFRILDGEPPQAEPNNVVALLAADTGRAVALFRDPDEVQRMTARLHEALVAEVRTIWAQTHQSRKPGKVNEVTVAEELRVMADAKDTLTSLAGALTGAAKEAQGIAREVLAEVHKDERKAATVSVADGHGWLLKVSRSQPTEATVELDDVRDVLTAWEVSKMTAEPAELKAYAHGVRDGMQALLVVLAKPGVKTTALDALVKTMEGAGEDDLALRLRAAYGRKSKGEPVVALKREQPKDGAP